jgi:hypothetical protein
MPNLKEKYPNLDEFSLVKEEDGYYCLFGEGEYPASSVLAGQHRVVRLEFYEDEETAKRETGLEVGEVMPMSCAAVPSCPPSDWDPMDAGEAWGEDDY